MKNLIKVLTAAVIVSVFLFTGCEKKEVKDNKLIEKDFEFVGEIHNLGLTQSFNNLKTFKLYESKMSSVELIEEMDINVITKLLTEEFDGTLLNVAIDQKNIIKNDLVDRIENNISTDGIMMLDSVIANTRMSNQLKDFFIQIAEINKDDNLSFDVKINEYNSLTSIIELFNNEGDIAVAYSVLNLTIASTTYWYEHYDEWAVLFNNYNKGPWSTVAGGDVAGAICGGLGGLLVGGVGAGPGALGGGILGSLGAAITTFF